MTYPEKIFSKNVMVFLSITIYNYKKITENAQMKIFRYFCLILVIGILLFPPQTSLEDKEPTNDQIAETPYICVTIVPLHDDTFAG